MTRDHLSPFDIPRSANLEAQAVLLDALEDCTGAHDRREALIAHLSVGAGLLAHEIGGQGAITVVRNILRAMEGNPS